MKFYTTVKKILFLIIVSAYIALIIKYADSLYSAVIHHYKAILYATALLTVGIFIQTTNYLGLLDKKHNISLLPTTKVWSISILFNYIAPFQAGLLIRAKYFNSKGVSYADSTATVLRQLHYSIWIALGLCSLTIPVVDNKTMLFKIACAVLFLSWLIFISPIKKILKRYRDKRFVQFSLDALKVPTFKQLTLSFTHYMIIACLFYMLLNEFNIPSTFTYSIFLSAIVVAASLIAITPNNLGIQELLIGYLIYNVGATSHEYVTLPFILRISGILACTILATLTPSK